jgi:hypothetical protein
MIDDWIERTVHVVRRALVLQRCFNTLAEPFTKRAQHARLADSGLAL